jgi:nitrate/nitrite-specific signal transduction histidine kinase
MFMTPPEVFPPLGISHFREHNILTVPLHQVLAVFTILSVVPRMIVAAVPIVIAPLMMMSVVGSRCDRSDDGGAQE